MQTLRVQQLAKVGLNSLNKLKTLGNVADLLTKQVPRGSTRQVGWNDGLHSLVKELQSFLRTQASTKITGIRKLQQLRNCHSSTMKKQELEKDVHSFDDKTLHLTTAVLRRRVEMSML